MALVQRTLSVTVLVEDDQATIDRTLGFIKTSLKGSCRNLHSGAVVLGLYDEHDRLVGLDVTGTASPELQEMAERFFEEETNKEGTG